MSASPYPSRSVRDKLLVAGIPESEHVAAALTARMPADFSTESYQDLSVDMIAELLLYFIAKGLVSQPVACEQALLDMPWGSHVCQFYEHKTWSLYSSRTSSRGSNGTRRACGSWGTSRSRKPVPLSRRPSPT